jgi:hypothetical protein
MPRHGQDRPIYARGGLEEASKATVPVLLIQAEHDDHLSRTWVLAQTLEELHKPFKLAIFPTHVTAPAGGQAFCLRGRDVWELEVFSFLTSVMDRPEKPSNLGT